MTRIFVPSKGPESWRDFLADPEKHWKAKYSARTLAYCWEACEGFPAEISCTLAQHQALANAEPLLIFPEWKVPLPGGRRSSQNDIWVLAKSEVGLISIAVEGKVEESFNKPLREWMADYSPGKEERISFLLKTLGLASSINDAIRYQLLHRTASAIIEAKRFGAKHAVMLVHSFSSENSWFGDFSDFALLFGLKARINRLVTTQFQDGLTLHLGWVHGNEHYLDVEGS